MVHAPRDRDLNASNDKRLVYREGPYLWIGLPLVTLAVAVIYGTGAELLRRWPNDAAGLLVGLVLGSGVLGVGARLLICGKVILDKMGGRIIKSSSLLFWRRTRELPFFELNSVSWKPVRKGESTHYVVQLPALGGDVGLLEVQRMKDARRIARETGEFLDLKQEHWDEALLNAEGKGPELRRAEAMTRAIRSLVGGRPMRCVLRSESRLVYAQSFSKSVRVFGCVAGPMGLLAMLSPWLGLEGKEIEDAPWVCPVVGGFFTVLSVIFLLGRRGITIDKEDGFASTWWGLGVPLRITRQNLSAFSAVQGERDVEEVRGRPCVVGRVSLSGDRGQRLILFKSIDVEEVKTLAEEIGAFLRYPIVGNP